MFILFQYLERGIMEKLRTVKNDVTTTLWCGPAAISAVTGESVSKIMNIMRQLSGRQTIKSVPYWLLQRTLATLGWEAVTLHKFDRRKVEPKVERLSASITVTSGIGSEWVEAKQRPTLARYCREHRQDFQEHACIVGITGHYVAVYGRRFCDSHTSEPVFLRKSPHRRTRVEQVFQIRKIGGPNWVPWSGLVPKRSL
jgi:hypothetical protein